MCSSPTSSEEFLKPAKPIGKFVCEECNVTFTEKKNLKRHALSKHGIMFETEKNRTKCNFPNCLRSFYHVKSFLEHLEVDHGVDTQTTTLQFNSEEEFNQWKEDEESKNFVYYGKTTQDSKSANSMNKNMYFVCQHDGPCREHIKSSETIIRKYKHKTGSVKTGIFLF